MDVASRQPPAPQSGTSRNAAGRTPPGRAAVDLTAVLDRLDSVDDSRFRNRRAGSRVSYRRTDVPMRISHPGGTKSTAAVATRNLSASGAGVLLDRFLHNGTRVELVLRRLLDQEPDVVLGKVVFCTHVAGAIHQVGIRFDAKIFPTLYAEPAIVP